MSHSKRKKEKGSRIRRMNRTRNKGKNARQRKCKKRQLIPMKKQETLTTTQIKKGGKRLKSRRIRRSRSRKNKVAKKRSRRRREGKRRNKNLQKKKVSQK